jgi:hypothetical protein
MSNVWTVVRNTGARVELAAGTMRKHIWRSQTMSRQDFFRLLPEGALLDEVTLRNISLILA